MRNDNVSVPTKLFSKLYLYGQGLNTVSKSCNLYKLLIVCHSYLLLTCDKKIIFHFVLAYTELMSNQISIHAFWESHTVIQKQFSFFSPSSLFWTSSISQLMFSWSLSAVSQDVKINSIIQCLTSLKFYFKFYLRERAYDYLYE